jgi:hypothetical protein
MDKLQILGIGRDPVILQKLLRFINENPNWEGTGTVDDESAVELFHQRAYNIIFFLDDVEVQSENKLRALFSHNNNGLMWIKHTGDSTGLLAAEIQEAIEKNRHTINVTDDLFKGNQPEQ